MASSNSLILAVKYPYPVEINLRNFVPVILSKQNYFVWRKLMLRLIESQGLVGFINGKVVAPPEKITLPIDDVNSPNATKEIENRDYQDWKRSDALLQRWIIGTISTEEFLPHVVCLKTAKDMWSKLSTLHERKIEYPYPVEINVRDFVPTKLYKDHNYFRWRKLMLQLIKKQGLVGFIDGEFSEPNKWIEVVDDGEDYDDRPASANTSTSRAMIENEDYKAWKKTDALLQSWIIMMIDADDHDMAILLSFDTAKQLWEYVRHEYVRREYSIREYSRDFSSETESEEDPTSAIYMPLHKAALKGDWKTAKEFIKQKPDAVRAFISRKNETALMIAVRSARGNHFVNNLLEFMSPDDLALRDLDNMTALYHAAIAGNVEAAKLLVEKNPDLPNYCSDEIESPLLAAAKYGRRKMVFYLLDVTKEDIIPKPFEGINGAKLVNSLIISGLYDIALLLIGRYPKLAWVQEFPALKTISLRSSAFRSRTQLNWRQSLIYSYLPTKSEDSAYHSSGVDVENPSGRSISVRQKALSTIMHAAKQILSRVLWSVTTTIVPDVIYIRDIKLKHEQALELVKQLCSTIPMLNLETLRDIIQPSLMNAASLGISEVVEEIFEALPEAVYSSLNNESRQRIFQVAILNRHENIFNLIYQIREEVRSIIFSFRDNDGNNCLDLVANLGEKQKLNLRTGAAGAALQMQRELMWFKEVEKISIDNYEAYMNIKKKSEPKLVFSKTHEELVKEGESWMKDTANSCTIIAALIATIMFAAAITVPGGNDNQSGLPFFLQDNRHNKPFIIFVISDALGLFSSASSLLIFLSILTSRYAEHDFLYSLPKRLITGLITLFVSIISMMVAFGVTLYLLFGHKSTWILFPIIGVCCIPVTTFAYSQFPLLFDMIRSTYGSGIFGKKSDRILL